MADDDILLAILALTLAVYIGVMWVNVVFNSRGDDIRSGVVKGARLAKADLLLLLYGNWLPYIAFAIGFMVFAAVGVLELARNAEAPRVRLIGYMSAALIGSGAVFHLLVGAFRFASLIIASTGRAEPRPGPVGSRCVCLIGTSNEVLR
jgi:hypothetical protein